MYPLYTLFIIKTKNKSAAIGVSGDYKERLSALVEVGLNSVCVDVAHGDHILVEKAIEYIESYDASCLLLEKGRTNEEKSFIYLIHRPSYVV